MHLPVSQGIQRLDEQIEQKIETVLSLQTDTGAQNWFCKIIDSIVPKVSITQHYCGFCTYLQTGIDDLFFLISSFSNLTISWKLNIGGIVGPVAIYVSPLSLIFCA